jgi:ABC-type multidrug transport system fused ATPase/permease subunit
MQEPIRNLPDLLSMLAQTKVSLDRIERFLGEEELQVDAVAHARNDLDHEAAAVEFHDAVFSWEDDDDEEEDHHHHHRRRHGHGDDAHDQARHSPVVRVSDLRIERRTRVAVCGMVGAGKSSFLSCMLGEIPRISGHVQVRGTIAYVAQSPWIQTGKVVDNILFRNPMDRQKYEAVLNACALVKDLELFSHGDGTEIGEKGINLSGGQKQRIQLARAIYDGADIYILDDPFSAVDAHTGMHLFKVVTVDASTLSVDATYFAMAK